MPATRQLSLIGAPTDIGAGASGAVMGPEAAVRVLFREEISKAADPAAREAELIAEYREKFFNPYRAADVGQIDEVIEPRETRPRLARALEVLRTKVQQNPPKKHGLCPV